MLFKFFVSFLFIISLLSCNYDKNPLSSIVDLKYLHDFKVEPGANGIAIDDDSNTLYLSHSKPYGDFDIRKIQKYSLTGENLSTLVDFKQTKEGNYSFYDPINVNIDEIHNIYVLVKAYSQDVDSSWYAHKGFCVIKYDPNGRFDREFDFAEIDESWFLPAMTFYNDHLYVTNGRIIKKISALNGQFVDLPIRDVSSNLTLNSYLPTSDMTIDPNGNIWLVGQAGFKDNYIGVHVSKLDPNCVCCGTIHSTCTTQVYGASLNNPGITLDRNGSIYVSTFYCGGVEVFSPEGRSLCEFEIKAENKHQPLPIDLELDKYEKLYVLDYTYEKIYVFRVEK